MNLGYTFSFLQKQINNEVTWPKTHLMNNVLDRIVTIATKKLERKIKLTKYLTWQWLSVKLWCMPSPTQAWSWTWFTEKIFGTLRKYLGICITFGWDLRGQRLQTDWERCEWKPSTHHLGPVGRGPGQSWATGDPWTLGRGPGRRGGVMGTISVPNQLQKGSVN